MPLELMTRKFPKLNCSPMQSVLLLLEIVMVISGRGCRAGTFSQAVHTLWLDPGLCIISSFFLQCVSQHDAELPTEGGGWAGYMCLGLGAVCGPTPCSLWLCAWLLHIFERRHSKLACESWVLIAAGALLAVSMTLNCSQQVMTWTPSSTAGPRHVHNTC